MNSRYNYLQDPQQRGRLALVRSSAAAAIVIALLVLVALAPSESAPGGDVVGTEFSDAATSTVALPPASVPDHIREAPGPDPLYPHEYAGQPSVF